MRHWLTIALYCLLPLLYSCDGGGSSSDPTPPSPEEPAPRGLAAFASDEELARYLKNGLQASTGNRQLNDYASAVEDAAATPASGLDGTRTFAYSQTTLQETGVDEADRVKNDGDYLYVATVPVPVYDYDAAPALLDSGGSVGTQGNVIRILKMQDEPPQVSEVAVIELDGHTNQVENLYLVMDDSQPDLLVTVGATSNNVWTIWDCAWCWQDTTTEIGIYDVSRPEAPLTLEQVTIDGQLIASRRIGDTLYLVTRFTPALEGYYRYPSTPQEQDANERLLEAMTLAELLPTVSVGAATTPLVSAQSTYLPGPETDRSVEPSLLTVTAINLRNPANLSSETLVGPAETVFVSTDSLVVATTRYNYIPMLDVREATSAALAEPPPETTDLHLFALTAQGPVYRGSGEVPGNLGWDAGKRPFRLGEHEGILRVATSLGDTWNDTSTTRLTLLRDDGDGRLEETAALENIGETGERLYAVRYLGERAYLVTFRITDPLYVFDLADPFAPRRAGELHIDGYSDYLYPVGETLLLGIGKDAVPDQGATDFGGRGAWYQGVKLALFDVADPANPSEIDAVVIGRRGTDSDALLTHHAVTFLPGAGDGTLRMALPVALHDTPPAYAGFDPDDPRAYYDWTHTGLYLFDISAEAIQEKGRMIVADRASGETGYYGGYGYGSDRSILVGDGVHYVHGNSVWSAGWGEPGTVTEPQ